MKSIIDAAIRTKNRLRRLRDGDSAQKIWKERVLAHAAAVNAYVDKGLSDGWKKAGRQPREPDVGHLAEVAIDAVRKANETGETDSLWGRWPPTHGALIPILKENGQDIPAVCVLEDGSVLARIGSPYEAGRTVRIVGDEVEELRSVGMFGRCPNRRYLAIAGTDAVEVTDGFGGDTVATCPWPSGIEDMPDGFDVPAFDGPLVTTQLVPFPDGRRVLLVSPDGIFVLSELGARRLLPTEEEMREFYEWYARECPNEPPAVGLSMEHGAVSPSGKLIAAGSQGDEHHFVFDEELRIVARVGPRSSYPHYAVFSADESVIAVNSCHFYEGVTLGIRTSLLPGLETASGEVDKRVPVLEDSARVYAGVSRGDELIVGDASGYVRAFSTSGEFRWQLFIGSTVGSLDVSADQKTLAVSTFAGFLSLIELDAGSQPAHQIGVGGHREYRRWVFWKHEEKPLIW